MPSKVETPISEPPVAPKAAGQPSTPKRPAPRPASRPTVFRATVEPVPLDLDADLVLVSHDLYEDLFGADVPDSPRFVALRYLTSAFTGFNWTLFSAKLAPQLGPSTCAVGPASRLNSLLNTTWIQISAVVPVNISHAVISVPAPLYSTLVGSGSGSITDLATQTHVLDTLGFAKSQIMRQGEIKLPSGCRVRICEPVDQGLFVRGNIKLTIVNDEHHVPELTEAPETNGVAANAYSDTDLDMEMSRFLDFDADDSLPDEHIELAVTPLDTQLFGNTLTPNPHPLDDMESSAFVRVELLAKIGCHSGDLVTVSSGRGTRHIRLYSYPEPNTVSSNYIYLSPFLIYNLGGVSRVSITRAPDLPLSKLVSVAKEVTISRIASPITTDRSYQPAFLSVLRTYFESSYRIVRKGDVIGVPVDTLLAQTLLSSGDDNINGAPTPSGRPNEVAWFKIASLVSSSASDTDPECIIDPSFTRMVQSGLVAEAHPSSTLNWRRYLSLESYPDYGLSSAASPNFAYAKRIYKLLKASISPKGATLHTSMLLHSSKRGAGKLTVLKSVAAQLGIHLFEIDCYSVLGDNDAKTIGALRARLDRAATIRPCLVVLRHLDSLAKKSEQDGRDGGGLVANLNETFEEYATKNSFILAATAADVDRLSESVRSKLKFEIVIPVPSEAERREIFQFLTEYPLVNSELTRVRTSSVQSGFRLRSDVSLDMLALQSAGLTPPDLVSIIDASKQTAVRRLKKVAGASVVDTRDLIIASKGLVKLTPEDITDSIGDARSKYSDSIGAPKIPNVGWQDVGGLEGVKGEILDSIEMPLKYPQLFSEGVKKRSGILFYGPPGTGKTLLAKAIATNFSLNFFSVKGPELLNMYIGESEANVRKVFQKARDAKPCVVFFDELDSVAPKRGNQGDSGGVMDRIVSQLLAELDGMSGQGGDGVFVVGATNRPDLLDEALLRPGRFDKMLYLGISDTHEKQETILQALTRKFALSPDVSLKAISEKCPFTYTGADFYAMSSDAMLNAMTRTAGVVDAKIKKYNEEERASNGLPDVTTRWWFQNMATKDDVQVEVTEVDFDKAQRELVPSVSADELRHYLSVRDNFEGGKQGGQPDTGAGQANGHQQINGHKPAVTNGLPKAVADKPIVNGKSDTHLNGSAKSKAKGKARIEDYDDDDLY